MHENRLDGCGSYEFRGEESAMDELRSSHGFGRAPCDDERHEDRRDACANRSLRVGQGRHSEKNPKDQENFRRDSPGEGRRVRLECLRPSRCAQATAGLACAAAVTAGD